MQRLFTDGGAIGANPSPKGGTWAWCLVEDETIVRHASGVIMPDLPRGSVSNNVAEYAAVTFALEAMPAGWSGTVVSDSKVTLGRVFCGWRLKGLPPYLVQRCRAALAKLSEVQWAHTHGHQSAKNIAAGRGSEWNNWCDRACIAAARGRA